MVFKKLNLAIGSPLSLFLLLEGKCILPRGLDESIPIPQPKRNPVKPAINTMYNIFHPYDPGNRLLIPVAHRIEPLIARMLKIIKPYPVPYTKGGIIAGIQDYSTQIASRGFSMFESIRNSAATRFFNTIKPPEKESAPFQMEKEAIERKLDNSVSHIIKLLNPHGRIDYAIQESVLENPYMSALVVHMMYWGDSDCASMVIRALYGIEHFNSTRRSSMEVERVANNKN